MKVAWVVVVASCGRVAFDPTVPVDGATARCPSDYVLISGSGIYALNMNRQHRHVPRHLVPLRSAAVIGTIDLVT